ncbi:MAG: sensor histidine kinase [Spirochaetia bacterium]
MFRTISDMIFEPVSNSIESGAGFISVYAEETEETYRFIIGDDGPGLSLEMVYDPFTGSKSKHASRKVHLGLPLLEQTVSNMNGTVEIRSDKEWGTSIMIEFPKSHIDCPPLGDLTGMFSQSLAFPGGYEMVIRRKGTADSEYQIVRSELLETLGELESTGSRDLVRMYIASQEEAGDKEHVCLRSH